MEREKIERINFLARKAKTEALSDEEKEEQTALRNEYRQYMMNSYMPQLKNTYVIEKDGTKRKLIKD